MKKVRREEVVIRIEVRKGREVIFSQIVPPFAGLRYECPEPVIMNDFGLLLWGLDVVPHIGQDTMAADVEPDSRQIEEDEMRTKLQQDIEAHRRRALEEGGGFFSRLLGPIMNNHEHEMNKTKEKPFACCVALDAQSCVEKAHHAQTFFDTCRCGATRYRNHNPDNNTMEEGPWV